MSTYLKITVVFYLLAEYIPWRESVDQKTTDRVSYSSTMWTPEIERGL